MMRNVYLQGELGEQFGSRYTMDASTYQDVFKCINANRPDFLPFIRECHQDNIGFAIETAGEEAEEKDLLVPLKEGDITISLVPAGSKKVGKILAAIAIVVIMINFPGTFAKDAAAGLSGGLSTAGQVAASLALNLAMQGIAEIMAPDPSVDGNDTPENYSFNGNAQNIMEGDPVPILYGRLRVPGRPISVNVSNEGSAARYTGQIHSGSGEITTVSQNMKENQNKSGNKLAYNLAYK